MEHQKSFKLKTILKEPQIQGKLRLFEKVVADAQKREEATPKPPTKRNDHSADNNNQSSFSNHNSSVKHRAHNESSVSLLKAYVRLGKQDNRGPEKTCNST